MKRQIIYIIGLCILIVSSPLSAQGTVEDQVFRIVGQQLGVTFPTKGEMDRGETDSFLFNVGYRTRGLDLNSTGGAPVCDNRARILGENEFVVGWVGYEIRVTVASRAYTFRTNSNGTNTIRCSGGRQLDNNFGAAPSTGATRSGNDVTDVAMRHLSTYLNLDTPLTREAVEAAATARANGESSPLPYRASYRWSSTIYTNSAFNCAARGQDFRTGDVAAYNISITVQGRVYQYRTSTDGNVLILCLGGRADPSSIGVSIPSSDS